MTLADRIRGLAEREGPDSLTSRNRRSIPAELGDAIVLLADMGGVLLLTPSGTLRGVLHSGGETPVVDWMRVAGHRVVKERYSELYEEWVPALASEDEVVEQFGFPPDPAHGEAIRRALVDQIDREQRGCGDTLVLRALCAQLFFLAEPHDAQLIWRAKSASFDAAASIDVQLLCGAGFEATRAMLASSSEAAAHLEACLESGDLDGFTEAQFLRELVAYYTDEPS